MSFEPKLERFAQAFDCGVGSCRRICNCGREFYNANGGWDFAPGEREELERSGATNLDWSVGLLAFEGAHYVSDCDCWHERAVKIMAFLDTHRGSIAKYLNGEVKTARDWADAQRIVEGDTDRAVLSDGAKPHSMAREMLMAAASTSDEGTVRLAAQLAGVPPCPKCGFIKSRCRCATLGEKGGGA